MPDTAYSSYFEIKAHINKENVLYNLYKNKLHCVTNTFTMCPNQSLCHYLQPTHALNLT